MLIGKNRKYAVLLAGMMLLAWGRMSLAAHGAERMDSSRQFSLTIVCEYDGEALAHEKFQLYKVQNMTEDAELQVSEEFEKYRLNFSEWEEDSGESLSEILTGYIKRDGLAPTCEGVTDETGVLRFSGKKDALTRGVYLVVGESLKIKDTTYSTESFFVSVPGMEQDQKFVYNVQVNPKYRMEKRPGNTDISVVKAWKDEGRQEKRPDSITVQLLRGDAVYDTQTLSEENNWRYTWTGLDGEADWNVVEKSVPEDYVVSSLLEGDTYTITNEVSSSSRTSKTGETQAEASASPSPDTPGSSSKSGSGDSIKKKVKKTLTSLFSGKSKKKKTSGGQPGTGSGETITLLPQTGLCWWPVPLLFAAGLVLLILTKLWGRKNIFFLLAGVILIASSFSLTVYNYRESSRAGREAAQEMQELEEKVPSADETEKEQEDSAFVPNPDVEMPVVTVNGHDYIGKLEIPSLNLKLPVMSGWSYPNLRIAPCRYTGSAYRSNLVIAAHNYSTHFGKLKELTVGDPVIFTDGDGNEFDYQVEDMEILNPTDVEKMTEGDWDLTLFTCTIGGRTRIVIRCT
jgi:sortase A